MKLFYLGPKDIFAHQAAMTIADRFAALGGFDLITLPNVSAVMQVVQSCQGWGVIAWESNVEDYVVPNLDALIDAPNAAGFIRVSVDVVFNAFTVRGHGIYGCTGNLVSTHPHGLAQYTRFIVEHHLQPEPASLSAAACRGLKPGRMTLDPGICGEFYGLGILTEHVQDFNDAHTELLIVAPRDVVQELNARAYSNDVGDFGTIITFIPLVTSPSILADLLDTLYDAGLNMTSFVSCPIKGYDETYSFIATLGTALWEPRLRTALKEIVGHGGWARTLAIHPYRERPSLPVDARMLPEGGAHITNRTPKGWQYTKGTGKEPLWQIQSESSDSD